jgi:glycosyltransferase involved in cell wall biosynthesis
MATDVHSKRPLVTLGMPVYNEVKYIEESLQNLLKQTYPNLEIIIADNASTDGTSEICESFAAAHANVRYIRHPKNIGQHINFNYLVRCGSGTYFCWVSGHDFLDPDFVEKSVAVLEADSRVVLAYPRTMNMTKEGQFTREKVRPFDIRSMTAERRFREVMWRVDCNYVYGTFRLIPMLESKLFQALPAADWVFLSEMAVKGTFAPVDTFKYYRMSREHVQTEVEKRHRIMGYLFPHKTFTDAQVMSKEFYRPTHRVFGRIVQDASFSPFIRCKLLFSVWLCGVMKLHLLPGADVMSTLVKKVLPTPVLARLMRTMQ